VAFVEDLSVFFADFAVDATLNASALPAIVDNDSLLELDGIVTQLPSALVKTSDAASAVPGQAFVASSVTYTVRQVLKEPPDGALTRLVLARS
jgi:hypothetical protein